MSEIPSASSVPVQFSKDQSRLLELFEHYLRDLSEQIATAKREQAGVSGFLEETQTHVAQGNGIFDADDVKCAEHAVRQYERRLRDLERRLREASECVDRWKALVATLNYRDSYHVRYLNSEEYGYVLQHNPDLSQRVMERRRNLRDRVQAIQDHLAEVFQAGSEVEETTVLHDATDKPRGPPPARRLSQ